MRYATVDNDETINTGEQQACPGRQPGMAKRQQAESSVSLLLLSLTSLHTKEQQGNEACFDAAVSAAAPWGRQARNSARHKDHRGRQQPPGA